MAPSATSLEHLGAASRVQRDILAPSGDGRILKNPKPADRRLQSITKVHRNRSTPGLAARTARSRASQVDDVGGAHAVPPCYTVETTVSKAMNTNRLKGGNSPVSPQHVDDAIGGIIRSRSPKETARAASRPVETVRTWRKFSVPEAWAALVNLLAHDDEVYLAVMELARRETAVPLTDDQERAIAEILKLLRVK